MKCIFNKDTGEVYGFADPAIQDVEAFSSVYMNTDIIDVEPVVFARRAPRLYVDLSTRTLVIVNK